MTATRGGASGRARRSASSIREERDALVNQSTIFENLDEMIDSDAYVQPRLF